MEPTFIVGEISLGPLDQQAIDNRDHIQLVPRQLAQVKSQTKITATYCKISSPHIIEQMPLTSNNLTLSSLTVSTQGSKKAASHV